MIIDDTLFLYKLRTNLKNYIFKKFFQYPVSIIVNSKKFKQQIDRKFNVESNLIYNPLNKSEILAKSKQNINLKKD